MLIVQEKTDLTTRTGVNLGHIGGHRKEILGRPREALILREDFFWRRNEGCDHAGFCFPGKDRARVRFARCR